jgi:hypothetical protein
VTARKLVYVIIMSRTRPSLYATQYTMLLVMLALLVRAFIPLGYMPGMAKTDGTFQMVVCSLDGPKTITVDLAFDPESSEKHEAASQDHCVFALLGHITPCDDNGLYAARASLNDSTLLVSLDDQYTPSVRLAGQAQPRAPPLFS